MPVLVPFLAGLLASFAYLEVGIVRTVLVMVLALAVWIGVLENAKTARDTSRPEVSKMLKLWAVYAAFMVISVLANSTSLKDDILIYLPGQALFVYFITASQIRKASVSRVLVSITVLHALLGIAQFVAPAAFDALFSGLLGEASATNYHFAIGRVTGIWGDAVRLGVALALGYPFVLLQFREKRSALNGIAVAVVLLAVLLTFTRVAIASVLISTLVVMWDARTTLFRRAAPVLVAAVVLVLAVQLLPIGQQIKRLYAPEAYQSEYATDLETYNRGRVLEALVPYALQSPLTGIGVSYKKYLSSGFSSAHNSLLQSVLLFGVPATVLLLGVIGALVDALRRALRRPGAELAIAASLGAIAVVIGGTTHGVLFDAPLNALFWMLAGIGLRQAADIAYEEKRSSL